MIYTIGQIEELTGVKSHVLRYWEEVVPEPYMTYLKNRIREDLGYDQIPVQLEFKGSRTKWEERE